MCYLTLVNVIKLLLNIFLFINENMQNLLIVIFLLIFFTTDLHGEKGNDSEKEKYRVVIVGAGIAGLSAATHLLKNNFTDFLILEASSRLGGRVYTASFGDFLIEYGAQWVHGQGGNKVYEIAEPYGVLVIENTNLQKTLIKNVKSKINMTLALNVFEGASQIFEDCKEMAACNCSMETYFDQKYENLTKGINIDESTRQAVKDIIMKFEGVHDGTDDLNNEGSWGNAQYWITKGSSTVAWKSGYHSFVNMMLGKYGGQELPVLNRTRFNKVVQRVNWSESVVDILCEDGSHYFTDHVISTVSLGVLKQTANLMFIPPLPERKLLAIKSLGFDLVNKIFIQFHTRWWPLEFDYGINFLWSNEDKQRFQNESKHGGWTTEIVGFHYVENQPRVLEGWLVGKAARKLENLSDEEVTDAVVELLTWFLGDIYSISLPKNITRSAWGSDRFVHGSYSFRTFESDRLGYAATDIAQPVSHNHSAPVLLFAGEATHDHYFSTVHGAFETGLREANRILSL